MSWARRGRHCPQAVMGQGRPLGNLDAPGRLSAVSQDGPSGMETLKKGEEGTALTPCQGRFCSPW